MTPQQIKAIQESFARVAPISEQAAAYGALSDFMIGEAYGLQRRGRAGVEP